MIRKCVILLFLVTLVSAQLSEECRYVYETINLTDVSKVEKCFNSYPVDQDVIDLIFKNLDIIQDIYPYVDIARNPPENPSGYFNKVDFTSGLADLKKKITESNKTFSQVFPPVMAFIKAFRDGHFSLNFASTDLFNNIFAEVYAFLPFMWNVDINDDYEKGSRHVYLREPSRTFLSPDAYQTILDMFFNYYNADFIDGIDTFTFLANIFGEYNSMKSAQGRLFVATTTSQESVGFPLLQFPIDGLFKEHTIEFSDPSHTKVKFRFGFRNDMYASHSTRDAKELDLFKTPFTLSQERETWDIIQNFKKRSVRSEHEILKCGLVDDMNCIFINSFHYSGIAALQYLQELAECIDDFNANDQPILIVMNRNGGGSVLLEQLTEYMLMPITDFNSVLAARKTDKVKKIVVDNEYFGYEQYGYEDGKMCMTMKSESQIEELWKYTETDKFGDVSHMRTKKLFFNFVKISQIFRGYRLRNPRKPTDIIVATDGYCFSACSIFVDNVIRFGAGIVTGFGVTHPDDVLFVAAQCPSTVVDPSIYFEELSNNSEYGLTFQVTLTETYNVSSKMDETIPGDYDILRIDKHMGYYRIDRVMSDDFIESAKAVHIDFQTNCNPQNKRLLMAADECELNDPHALYAGYACGANGEWNNQSCKIGACEPPYVVDFEQNKCVPSRPCDINYVPVQSTGPSVMYSAAVTLSPSMNLVTVVLQILLLVSSCSIYLTEKIRKNRGWAVL